jgi:hypothetical protein
LAARQSAAAAAVAIERENALTHPCNLGRTLLAAALAIAFGNVDAQALPGEGKVALKYLDYVDSQPGRERVRVKATSVMAVVPVSQDWSFAATKTVDVISGASPAYHSSGLGKLTDLRTAQDFSVTRFLFSGTVTGGVSLSTEADYVSRAVSLSAAQYSEDRNTTWSVGAAQASDDINPTNRIVRNESKQVTDALLGWTRVLTPNDLVQLNVGRSWGEGYFSDPYKVFDNRPRVRTSTTLQARWNHHFEANTSTLRMGYRWFSDNWGVQAHTATVEWVKPMLGDWTVGPLVRFHNQRAADFYVDADLTGSPFPPNPPPEAVVFSEDHRLSSFGALTLGVKLSKKLDADWTVDMKVEHYAQRSAWYVGGAGSPGLEPFFARSVQLGISRAF